MIREYPAILQKLSIESITYGLFWGIILSLILFIPFKIWESNYFDECKMKILTQQRKNAAGAISLREDKELDRILEADHQRNIRDINFHNEGD